MENLLQDISRIINEITAMQEAYPVAFGIWSSILVLLWSFPACVIDTLYQFRLKRSLERLNNKNGRTAKKKRSIEQCKK